MKKESIIRNIHEPIETQITDVIRFHSPSMVYDILNGFDADEIGYGEIGSKTSPILVNGLPGVFSYFLQLHSQNHMPVKYRRIKSSISPVCPHPSDLYHIETIDHSLSKNVWVNIYARRRTNLCPPEFVLYPFSED